jgi:type I restriction enzyme S subunit
MVDGWQTLTGEDLTIKITKGSSPKWQGFEYQSDGVLFVTSENVRDGFLDVSEPKFLPAEFSNKARNSRLKFGDILVNIVGASIGRACRFNLKDVEANVNQAVCILRLKPEFEAEYFLQLLQSPHVQTRLLGERSDSARPNLSLADFRDFTFELPPRPEQRKIAEILRSWDETIENLVTLRKAKAKRLQAIVQRLLAPSRAIGRGIPRSNWALTRFGAVFEERRDVNRELGPDDVVTVGKYAIRKQSEHFTRSVASQDLSKYWIISPGDFVYDPMSAYYGAIGRYRGEGDGLVSPAYRVIRLDPAVDAEFMTWLLRSHPIRFQLEARSSQGNKEGKRRLLQRDEFAGIEFNLPPLEVQRDIATRLTVTEHDVALTDREIAALKLQKRGLMQKLLTGEWRVNI